MFLLAIDSSGLFEMLTHFLDLAGVSPVWPGFDGNNVPDAISIKFKINAFCVGFAPSVDLPANMNGEGFKEVAKNGFFLRGKMGIKQLLYEIGCCLDMFCLEQIRVFSGQNSFQL